MPDDEKLARVNFMVAKTMRDELNKASKAKDLTTSQLLRRLVGEFLEKEKKQEK